MPVLGPNVSKRLMHLRAEVTKDNNRRLVWAEEEGTDKELKVLERLLVVVHIKLKNDHVGFIRNVVGVTKAKVVRIHTAHRAIGYLGRGMREYVVPPLQETRGIAANR
jgi:hypothetical protein